MLTELSILVKNKFNLGGELTDTSPLKTLFLEEKAILNDFFDKIDYSAADKLFVALRDCQGMVIITGVGKSGLIAEKMAMTLTSTGTRALFISPMNALHGDIGIVTKDDVFIMLSKSGESDELLQLIPFLRNRGTKIISIVNNGSSRLGKASDLTVTLPITKELCPFDIVPTVSSVTQMLFGDVLAVALMVNRGFSLEEFARNHPAGKIGRRLTLRVRDLMVSGKDIPLCYPEDLLVNVLEELSNKKCGCVLVIDQEGIFKGIFTDGDFRRSIQKIGTKALESKMKELMIPSARQISQEAMATAAFEMMEGDQKRPITVLPVVDDAGKVVGLIKLHDIVQSGL